MRICKKVIPQTQTLSWPPTISATRRGYFFRSPLEWLTWPFFFGGIYVIPPPSKRLGLSGAKAQNRDWLPETWQSFSIKKKQRLWNPSNPRSESLTPDFGVSQIHTKYTCKVDSSQFGWFTLFVLFHLNLFHIIYQQHHHLYLMFCIIIFFDPCNSWGPTLVGLLLQLPVPRLLQRHPPTWPMTPSWFKREKMNVCGEKKCHYACFFWIPEIWSTPLKHGCFRMFMCIYISTGTGCRRLNL